MTDLLTIYSTQETLQDIVESLIGEKVGCRYGEGICGDLGRVYGIIKRHPVLPANEDPLSSFEESPLGRVLANREMNNRRPDYIGIADIITKMKVTMRGITLLEHTTNVALKCIGETECTSLKSS